MTKVPLICMRLEDMHRVHPQQITAACERCGMFVGVYPSGQNLMRIYPGTIELVCQVCRPEADTSILAPGAEHEPFESKRKQ
jgi:hypothetical protein